MKMQDMVKNPAFTSCPGAFELRNVIGQPDAEGFPRCKAPLVFRENGDVEFNLWYGMPVDVTSAELHLFCDYKGNGPTKFPMAKQENNWWKVVVPDIEEGVHVFCIIVNGVPCLMPNAPMYYNGDHFMNYVDVPDPNCDSYLLKDIPHGDVRERYYFSKELNKTCACTIYTPPGYDDSDEDYPVLYLQHGGGENEWGWFGVARANFILDDLIHQGKCERMVVVCNNGFTFKADEDYTKTSHLKNLAPLLANDCAPFIEKTLRVKKGKANRALAGLSMGSFETLYTACYYPDFADYIGIMSGPTLKPLEKFGPMMTDMEGVADAYKDVDKFNASHKLLYFSKGNQEGGKELLNDLQPYMDQGIKMDYFTCEGNHEFQTWRRSLIEFLPKLFK